MNLRDPRTTSYCLDSRRAPDTRAPVIARRTSARTGGGASGGASHGAGAPRKSCGCTGPPRRGTGSRRGSLPSSACNDEPATSDSQAKKGCLAARAFWRRYSAHGRATAGGQQVRFRLVETRLLETATIQGKAALWSPRHPPPTSAGSSTGVPGRTLEALALGGGRRKCLPDRAKLQDDHAMNTPVVHRVGGLINARLLSLVRE